MWKTMEDVHESLFEYSHLEYPSNLTHVAPPVSIAEYRARTASTRKPGLFDEQPESKEIFISGRGKNRPATIIRPGKPVLTTPEEDRDIRKQIREVSGLGYSNELIERMYGNKDGLSSEEEEDEDITLPNLKLVSIKEESSQNASSSTESEKEKSSTSWNEIVENETEEYEKKGSRNRKSGGIGKSHQKM